MAASSWQTLQAAFLRRPPPARLPMISTAATRGNWAPLPHPATTDPVPTLPLSRLPTPLPAADTYRPGGKSHEPRLLFQQLSNPELVAAQDRDPLCQAVRHSLQPSPTASQTTFDLSVSETKHALQIAPSCLMGASSGLLLRAVTWRTGPRKGHTLHVVLLPNRLVPRMLHLCHDSLGHQGRGKMLWFCQSRFYFPKLRSRVDKYLRSCDQCNRAMRDLRPAAFGHVANTGLNDRIAIDFAGPFRAVSANGLTYLAIASRSW